MTVVSYIYQDGTYSPSLCRLYIFQFGVCLVSFTSLFPIFQESAIFWLTSFSRKVTALSMNVKTSVFQYSCQVLSFSLEIDLLPLFCMFYFPSFVPVQGTLQLGESTLYPSLGPVYIFMYFLHSRCLQEFWRGSFRTQPSQHCQRLFGCGDHGSPSCFLLAGLPRRLPCHLVLFTQPLFLLSHLRIETLLLSLWLFSVFRVYSHAFMTEQQFSPQRPSETPLALLMIPFWNASLYGAHDSVIFPLLPLQVRLRIFLFICSTKFCQFLLFVVAGLLLLPVI